MKEGRKERRRRSAIKKGKERIEESGKVTKKRKRKR